MSVLTRDAILAELAAGRVRIEPFEEDQLGVASIDLTLGDEIRGKGRAQKVFQTDVLGFRGRKSDRGDKDK